MLLYDERGLTLFRDLCVYIYIYFGPMCRSKFVPTLYSKICSKHFKIECYLVTYSRSKSWTFSKTKSSSSHRSANYTKARAVKTNWLMVKYLNKHQSPDLQHRQFLHHSCLQVISWYSHIHLISRIIIQDNTKNNWQCESTIDVCARNRLKNKIRMTNVWGT